MRVLVTGHAGFIGFHLSKELLRRGHQVVGLDALTDYYDPALKAARLDQLMRNEYFTHVHGRLEDRVTVESMFAEHRPQIVVHLAAQAGVRYSIENPSAYVSANVAGTQTLLEVAAQVRPEHTLIASTSSVYGGNTALPFSESHTTQSPVSLYAATKIATEALAHSYAHLYDMPTTCFRFFTVYGPWGRPDMALFKFVRAIRQGEAIDVYGEGQMRRDFTYIDDLVDCIVRLMDHRPVTGDPVQVRDTLSPVAPYRIVNMGAGAPVGLLRFITAIEGALGVKAQKNMLPMQPGDVVETFSDPSLLKSLIGDVPSTDIEAGVERFTQWYIETYEQIAGAAK